jgi:hypothetical protein
MFNVPYQVKVIDTIVMTTREQLQKSQVNHRF